MGTGTLISRDQNEEVVGDATVTGFANGDEFKGTLRIVVNKDHSITFPGLPGSPTLHQGPGRSTQATAPKCSTPAAKPKTPTTATSGATFTLTTTKVTNPNAPELTIDAAAGKATWDHTGQYGGAGKGGEWKVAYTFKVPQTITAGKSFSITLGLAVSDAVPVQPLAMAIGARAPDFVGQVPVNYPNPASASKTFTVPLSTGYKEFKDLVIIVGFVSAEITFAYHRAGS
jgi:hypothetical protein